MDRSDSKKVLIMRGLCLTYCKYPKHDFGQTAGSLNAHDNLPFGWINKQEISEAIDISLRPRRLTLRLFAASLVIAFDMTDRAVAAGMRWWVKLLAQPVDLRLLSPLPRQSTSACLGSSWRLKPGLQTFFGVPSAEHLDAQCGVLAVFET